MNALQIYTRQEMAAQEFSNTLFNDFIAWIGRGQETTRSYLNKLRQFMAWMKYAAITRPVRSDIISYRDWLEQEHEAITLDDKSATGWAYRTDSTGQPIKIVCKAGTVAQYLQSVRQFFKWTASEGLYPNIADNIHAPKITGTEHKRERLQAAEVLKVERSIAAKNEQKVQEAQGKEKDTAGRIQRSTEQGKRLFAMYLLAVNAGLRTVEISRANIKDLVTKDGKCWLYVWGKGHSEADTRKPLAPEVAAAIREYIASRTDKHNGSSPLFVSTGNRSGGKRILPTTISTMLKRALQEAGFDDERITAHSLRHSAGCAAMAVSNENIYETQQYMRHLDPKTTEIYLHESDKEEEKAEALAQGVYNYYHSEGDTKQTALEKITAKLSALQLGKLLQLAEAMA